MQIKVNASISDFPFYISLETFFREYKKAGVDGVEIVGGYKSRWSLKTIFKYAQRYQLPVLSMHQPLWSGVNIYFDEKFFADAARFGIQKITFHPLIGIRFANSRMQKYFSRLSALQQKYNITVCLENMPNDRYYNRLFSSAKDAIAEHIEEIHNITQAFGFSMTYDVSHAEFASPQKERIFTSIFPTIANIHMSSFGQGAHHLPVYEGALHTDDFIEFLIKKKYKGLLTLEVHKSFFMYILSPFNFSQITKSVAYIKEKARTL